MSDWTWDNKLGKYVQVNSGGQSGPYPHPLMGSDWRQGSPATHNEASAYGPYNHPGGPYGRQLGPYGQPQVGAPGNWGQWSPAGSNHEAPAYVQFQPGGPLGPYAGETGFPPQQYRQGNLLIIPSGHLSNVPSNQNQQREMGMEKVTGQAGGQRCYHRRRGRGRGRIRNITYEKKSEVGSECRNEENDESEEDYSDSEDTDPAVHFPRFCQYFVRGFLNNQGNTLDKTLDMRT